MKIRLSGPQSVIFSDPHRFRVLVAGRRFGKSFLVPVELLRSARRAGRGSVSWWIFSTYRQGKQVGWKPLLDLARSKALKVNESDLSIELKNGATVAIRGTDKPDSLRGVGLDLGVFDEYADQDPTGWTEVIRPALADRKGSALWVGTPKGWNHFRDLYEFARSGEDPDWSAHHYTTLEGGNVSPEEVEAARKLLDERTFRQEFEASFESVEGRVYYGFSREPLPKGNLAPLPAEGSPVLVGMDFNVDPMTAVLGYRAGDELHLWGELYLRNSNTEEMADAIRRLAGGRQVIVYPDPSGQARKTSAPVGQTDLTILRGAGFAVYSPPSAPPVVDRINSVNSLLRSGDGRRRLLISPSCRNLIHALDGLVYKVRASGEATNEPDKSAGLDHITDALGYLVWGTFPLGGAPRLRAEPLRL